MRPALRHEHSYQLNNERSTNNLCVFGNLFSVALTFNAIVPMTINNFEEMINQFINAITPRTTRNSIYASTP